MTPHATIAAVWLLSATLLQAAEARINKVLPHVLDDQGRHALAPSLYERDAYQAQLRKQPEKIRGIRFDIHWRAQRTVRGPLTLRLELRTANRAEMAPLVLETAVKPGLFGRKWSSIHLDGERFTEAGSVLSWQATLLDGGRELAAKRSFLW